jgi:hypothetical protein
MISDNDKWTWKEFFSSFFPFQLIIGQLKYNLISLFYWSLLFAITADSFGSAFGIPFLFFSPEYLGEVSSWSFFLVGFSVGGFTMAFNTYSYIKLGPRYPFLAAVSRPFFKFCLNNFIVPVGFLIFYLIQMSSFQAREELESFGTIALYNVSFLLGFFAFLIFSILYFFPTTRDKHTSSSEEKSTNPISSVIFKKEKWYNFFRSERPKTFIYIGKGLKLFRSRSVSHLERDVIERVFAYNRINATIFEVLTIVSFFVFSFFRDSPSMEFPAAMSIVLLLTLFHMIFSFLMSWFHRWTYPLILGSILFLNYLSVNSGLFKYTNYAYGLNYEEQNLQDFSIESIRSKSNKNGEIGNSRTNYISILEKWKKNTGEEKPKLIIINTSGGGSRSALWTFTILQNCDYELGGKLNKHIQLITGASGGMVGASYFRELLLRYRKNELKDFYDNKYKENLGKDLLNKLSFSASTNDMFIRLQEFEHNGRMYTKDRGYAFEEHLHENTNNVMRHDLGYYENPEKMGQIPVMIFSPTIVNDGRRLLISSQSLSFLTETSDYTDQLVNSYENIDYQTFFKENDPQKIRFSSVMRSSATFPFIMPMVTMPTKPGMQLMDAGIRDNYGRRTSVEFLFHLTEWIKENTSGVIIIEVRDTKKILNNENYSNVSFLDKITLPFGNMYNNFPKTQDFDQEQLMDIALHQFQFPVDVISFNLREETNDRISLSWHLTRQEKSKIAKAYYSESNQKSLDRLTELLKKSK